MITSREANNRMPSGSRMYFGSYSPRLKCAAIHASWVVLGALIGIAGAQHGPLVIAMVGALLMVFVAAKLNYAIVIPVTGLYAAFSSMEVVSITLGARRLFLSPGDLGLMVAGITMGAWLLVSWSTGRRSAFRIPFAVRPFLRPLLLLGALFIISTLVAQIGSLGTRIDLARNLLFCTRWLTGPLLLVLGANARIGASRLGMTVIFLSLCMVSGFGLWISSMPGGFNSLAGVLSSPFVRAGGGLYDPNQLGQVTSLLMVLCVALLLTGPKRGGRVGFFLAVVLLAPIVALTQSRESVISLVVSLGVLGWRLSIRRRGSAGLAVFIASVTTVWFISLVPRVSVTLAQVRSGQLGEALNGRVQTWRAALSAIAAHPFMGIGFDSLSSLTSGMVSQAHNGVLQAAVVSGIPGSLLYVWLLIMLVTELYRLSCNATDETAKALLLGLFAAAVGYEVTALVSDHFITFYTYSNVFWGLTGLTMANLGSVGGDLHEGRSRSITTI